MHAYARMNNADYVSMVADLLIGVVRVEFFESVFPFSRFPVAKTPLALTNHWPSTGLREYGQKVFLTPGVKKTRYANKHVQGV